MSKNGYSGMKITDVWINSFFIKDNGQNIC
uniref:Uncharacterized protein n=1 Tax=Arundo donax TaxID=35708 RepID=A0A0A8Z3Y2_ARUDO